MAETKIHYMHDIHSGAELIFCDNSAISYPLHNHVSVFTVGMVLEGSVLLRAGQSSKIYGKDQIFAILPYVPHSITAKENYSLLSLCIRKDIVSRDDCRWEKIKSEIVKILTEAEDFRKISRSQMIHFLSYLYSVNESGFWGGENTDTSLVSGLKQRIEKCPESKFSVEEMARAAFTSKYHFIRSFKKEVGLTPHQFQIQNRIRKAQRLMNRTETITEVALNTGFCDQSHFIKQFEKMVGLTPTAYKMSCNVFAPDSEGQGSTRPAGTLV